MRISKNETLFSASDLNKFLGCKHSVFLDYRSHFEVISKRDEDPMNMLLQARGDNHERAYWDELRRIYPNHIEIDRDGSDQERAEKTIKAMKEGIDVIFQGYLRKGSWQGYTDFLVKVPCEHGSQFGNWSYEVWDTKLARQSNPKYILQLCLYSWMLKKIQGIMPKSMHVVLSSSEGTGFKTDSFRVVDHISYFNQVMTRFAAFTADLTKDSAHPAVDNADDYPWPCNQCKYCPWTEHCGNRWEKDSALSLVANIRRNQAEKLHVAGIHTMAELAKMDPNDMVTDIGEQSMSRLIKQAKLQQEKVQSGKSRAELVPCPSGKGFDRMPEPSEWDLFFDMEGDPLHPNGLEYLFGVYYRNESDHMVFRPFWGHDHDQERQAFIDFMDFVKAHIEKHRESYIYHYNHYETTALKRLAGRYKAHEETLDNLLRQGRFVDLYVVVRETIQTTEPGYSIKNLEAIYWPDNRNSAVANAAESIIVYNKWRTLDDSSEKERLLASIADYNRVDCESTFRLRDWLLGIGGKHENFSSKPFLEASEQKEWEKQYQSEESRLKSGKSAINSNPMITRLLNILEFHKREEKSQWWAYFERKGFDNEQAIESLESISGLTLVSGPAQYKRSSLYQYSYPSQEFKIGLKDNVEINSAVEIPPRVSIHDIDEQNRVITLKTTAKKMPEMATLILSGPIPSEKLRSAIYRFASSIPGDIGKYPAIIDILEKRKPRLKNITSTDPSSKQDMVSMVRALDSSYLIVQGPPGTGKTHRTAACIIELLKDGKKIGVSANSHKAIHNLLRKIEEMSALDRDVSLKGVKRSNSSSESEYNSLTGLIINSSEIKFEEINLIAGTAWLFTEDSTDQKLDYLFIDEAGQVSLANVVAMGTSARNIVLVGDQMQLEQPIQGSHPDEIGMSALEFLLDGEHTVPDDMGIFLATTWRLRPEICQFISDAVYDGRLVNEKTSALRSIDISTSILPKNSGIILKSIKHQGSTQKSEAEAKYLVELYQSLLGCNFNDLDRTRPLGIDDILVVAPYNVQVNYLRSLLPPGARVGTIDKFQGQEAPVVLISMTTSSPEDIPRGMDFLYSKNRLNVALSRAQCLAVMVYSPKLLDAECKSVLHTNLVNTFCWLKEYSGASGGLICET